MNSGSDIEITRVPPCSQAIREESCDRKRLRWFGYFPAVLSGLLALFLSAGQVAVAQTLSPDALYRDAAAASERGDLAQAIALYKQLVELQPDSAEARTNLGVVLAHAGNYDEAILQYKEALRRAPKNPVIQLNLALAWYKQANFDEAAAELERLRQVHPENRQSLYLLADCYLRMGKNHETITLLEPDYEHASDDRAVDYALGMALIADGQKQKGAAVIDRILKDGSTAESDLLIGAVQLSAGDHRAASITLRRALGRNPKLPGGWSLLGRALLDNEDNDGAKAALRRALDEDPNDFDANLYLGGTLRHDGQLTEAASFLEKALRLRPNSVKARYQVGALHAASGNLEEALKDLEQVEQQSPEFQQVHVQLALVYQRLKRPQDAEREREIVRKLDDQERESPPKQ